MRYRPVCIGCLVVFVAFVVQPVFSQGKKEISLTIMTYNIYHGEDPYNRGRPNIDSVAALINSYKPDVVVLQEVDSMTTRLAKVYGRKIDWMKELGKRTGMYGYFARAISFGEGGYGEGLLSKKMLEFTVTALPAPKGGEDRSMISIEYPVDDKRKVTIAGTHLCHEHSENRLAQLKAINVLLKKKEHPALLAGDLNLVQDSPEYRQEIQPNWMDAAVTYGRTTNSFSSDEPNKRIDYVLTDTRAKWQVESVEVVPVKYSDHMPVIVKLKLLL